jgi:hypothetical protein
MSNPNAVHFWSKVYHEEALREANMRHLAQHIRAGGEPRKPGRLALSLRSTLVSLRGA